MIIAVAGGKGSPGATAVAALVAAAWRTDPADAAGHSLPVLLEADPEGGVLAARWHRVLGVTHEPGLLSLAAARDGSALERLRRHSQRVGDTFDLVAGPPGAPQADACLRELGARAAETLREAPVVCVVDCGRLHPASPALAWAREADHFLMVARPRLDEVVGLAPAAERLSAAGLAPTLVCVGTSPFEPAEVAEHAGLSLAGVLVDDPAAFAALFAHGPGARRVRRGRLRRSVATLIETLAPLPADEPTEEAATEMAAETAGAS
jgi:MinD-like ATPase involved in chromosome partitioning or flagellar assembly